MHLLFGGRPSAIRLSTTVSSSKSKPIDPIWSDSRNFVKAIVFVSFDNKCEKEISNERSRQTIRRYISQPIKQSLVFVREHCARHTQIVSTTIVRFHCSFFLVLCLLFGKELSAR